MTVAKHRLYWSRMYACLSFRDIFIGIECLDYPQLLGQPLAIPEGLKPAKVSALSAEAAARGVHQGMNLLDAQRRCPQLQVLRARPERYAEMMLNIIAALRMQICTNIEVVAADRLFLDLSRVQAHFSSARELFARIHEVVAGVLAGCSLALAISGDKTTAKMIACRGEAGTTTVIPPWHSANYLRWLPITDITDSGTVMASFLRRHDIEYCGQMRRIPVADMRRQFGQSGKKLWLMSQGRDPASVSMPSPSRLPVTVTEVKVLPPATTALAQIESALFQCTTRISAKLRQHGLLAVKLRLAVEHKGQQNSREIFLAKPDDEDHSLLALCVQFLREVSTEKRASRVLVAATTCLAENEDHTDPFIRQASFVIMNDLAQYFGDQMTSLVALHQRLKPFGLARWHSNLCRRGSS